MAKSWRPEGWEKIVDDICSRILDIEGHDGDPDLVEAGADAMLKSLREHSTTLLTELSPNPVIFKGCTLVLLPDDDGVKK